MTIDYLMDILETFLDGEDDYSSKILDIEKFFKHLVKSHDSELEGEIVIYDNTECDTMDEDCVQKLAFKMAWSIVVESISRGQVNSRIQALDTAIKLIKMQSQLKINQNKKVFYFPSHMLQDILKQLLSSEMDNNNLFTHFKKYAAYNDILFHCWKILPDITISNTPNNIYVVNYLAFLQTIPLRKEPKKVIKKDGDNNEKPQIFCQIEGGAKFKFDINCVRKSVDKCWKFISSWKLQGQNLLQSILLLVDFFIPHISRPLLVADFLMDSMNTGGTISILCLQGIFTLMQKHNLEYPLIYNRLYNMYDLQIFFTKQKSRLLFLTDTFLSSTHLPEAMVAGFAKKFARLALQVPSSDAIVLLHMISNLIIRHPGLKKMLDAHQPIQELSADPYDVNEVDPSLSKALHSSLWEIADMKNHAHPVVAAAAAYALMSHHNTMEKPIGEFLDDTENDLIEREFKKQYKDVFLSTKQPQSIADSSENRLTQYWQLF